MPDAKLLIHGPSRQDRQGQISHYTDISTPKYGFLATS
ncbi:hypothetical protein BDK92_4913 [Micromonospora pisi]|uniref:Uncharacterized protein n=1 Tax=Micromonospora pisi TaxID=589240 RepID=A0A495JPT4_9ACTN|nr:hypothetical protein BDK92_4913 [Micromonospora pisi]